MILNRDGKYSDLVPRTLRFWGIKVVLQAFRNDGGSAMISMVCELIPKLDELLTIVCMGNKFDG